jgi:uncharacterized protein
MHVAQLWRYPVKSLAGERLDTVEVGADGFAGDRRVHVRGPRDRVLTARTHPRLLGLHGTLGPDGEPRVDGHPWTSLEAAAAVQHAAGPAARLARWDGPERFDVLPLTVLTDGAIARLGADPRRLRPNLIVAWVDGMAEQTWPGRELEIGAVRIGVAKVRQRCVMTTYDPDTQAQDLGILRRIVDEFGGSLALDCFVIRGGRLAVGDPVVLR